MSVDKTFYDDVGTPSRSASSIEITKNHQKQYRLDNLTHGLLNKDYNI